MIEAAGSSGTATLPGQASVGEGLTAGAMLRKSREAAGLHLGALAVALKVSVRKLEALEQDRLDLLPDAVFARALASSVCRTLKIDPCPVLDRMPQSAKPRLAQTHDGINTPFRAPSDGAPSTWVSRLSRPAPLVAIALLLGALGLFLFPSAPKDDKTNAVVTPGVEVSHRVPAALPAPGNDPQPPSDGAPSPARLVQAASVALPPPAPAMTPPADVAAPASSPPSVAAPVAKPASATGQAPTMDMVATGPGVGLSQSAPQAAGIAVAPAGIVVFRAKSASWVEVTDAKGVVAIRKILVAGEAAAASGDLPLQVTVGRVDTTEVQVRGKSVDLRPVSHDNVARFEVK